MILRYAYLSRHPAVFHAMTGLTVALFDDLVTDLLPACVKAKQQRLTRQDRRRVLRQSSSCWSQIRSESTNSKSMPSGNVESRVSAGVAPHTD